MNVRVNTVNLYFPGIDRCIIELVIITHGYTQGCFYAHIGIIYNTKRSKGIIKYLHYTLVGISDIYPALAVIINTGGPEKLAYCYAPDTEDPLVYSSHVKYLYPGCLV